MGGRSLRRAIGKSTSGKSSYGGADPFTQTVNKRMNQLKTQAFWANIGANRRYPGRRRLH